jgi:SdrD B-like protein/SprB-like repeat protein
MHFQLRIRKLQKFQKTTITVNNHLPPQKDLLQASILWRKKLRRLLPVLILTIVALSGNAQLSVNLISQNPQCGGFATGVITAIPNGGVMPYSYLWNTGATSNPITGLPPGIYSVTVTDILGNTATATDTLTAPPAMSVHINVDSCTLPGAMSVAASGGVPPYDYTWNTGDTTISIINLPVGEYCVTVLDGNNCGFVTCQHIGQPLSATVSTTGVFCGSSFGGTATAYRAGGVPSFSYLWNTDQTTKTIENLPPGIYTATVTSYNGCTATASGTVGLIPGLLGVALDVQQPTCSGSLTGRIEATVPVGGGPPFNFKWSTGESGPVIDSLSAGTYSVTVTDNFGCSGENSATLNYQSHLTASLSSENPACFDSNDGTITALPADGVPPYSYLWSNGDSTETIENLGAGIFVVTVTDSLLCTATVTDTLVSPPPFTVALSATDASQCGAADGTAIATPEGGGSAPFTFAWVSGETDSTLTNLPAGTYIVKVVSSEGCFASDSVTVHQPDTLTVSVSGTQLLCGADSSGTLTAAVTYGTGPFQFEWSNGDTTQTASGLPSGLYTVTVTSAEGCTGQEAHIIVGSPEIAITLTPENPGCHGSNSGDITSAVSGGLAPLFYLWSNGASGPEISNLPAGNYTLTVTDDVGCSQSQSTTITEPDSLALTINQSPGSCGENGFIELEITGGTLPHAILWNTGDTTATLLDIPAGTYSATVTDGNGCQITGSTMLPELPGLELDITHQNTVCNGSGDGYVQAWASQGTPPYSYHWSNGSTASGIGNLSPGNYQLTLTDAAGCTLVLPAEVLAGYALNVTVDAPDFLCQGNLATATASASNAILPASYAWSNGQTSESISNLPAGTYGVSLVDALGCFGEASATIAPAGDFDVTETVENISCSGSQDGEISLGVTGGLPPLIYAWNTGAATAATGNLGPGAYSYQISDSAGCSFDGAVTLIEPTALSLEITVADGSCGELGTAAATVLGGSPNYSFLWSNSMTTPEISNLDNGSYSLTVTDDNGCQTVDSAAVQVFDVPACSVGLNLPVSTIGGDDGEIQAQVTGGIGPFAFNWDNGDTAAVAANLPPGTYNLLVTDVDNCQTGCSFTLHNPGRIGDFAWLDENGNGTQDAGEAGTGGLNVTLEGSDVYDNPLSQTTTTDASGIYFFVVQPGSYKLFFETPPDRVISPPNQSPDDLDSDADPATGLTEEFALGDGESAMNWDAGFAPASPCGNATSGGTICCDQTLCAAGDLPQPIEGATEPAGGSGTLEYAWRYSTLPGPFDPATWTVIPAAGQPGLAPGTISETTWFVRLARRENCQDFLASNIVAVNVEAAKVVAIQGSAIACTGNPSDFSTGEGEPGASYSWSFGDDADPATAQTADVEDVRWSTPGSKMVVLTIQFNGCSTTDTLLVEVLDNAAACNGGLIISAGKTGPFAVDIDWNYPPSDSVQRFFQVEWASGSAGFTTLGGPGSITTDGAVLQYKAFHHSPVLGKNYYRVHLLDDAGSELYSNVEEVVITGEFNLVNVFPNPFGNIINVEFFDRHDATISLELVAPDGRLVRIFKAPEEGFSASFEVGDLAGGLYFLKVKYDGALQKIYKLVKI